MTLEDDPGEPTPPARLLGLVFLVVGAVGVVAGAIATIAAVVVFGVVAALLGVGLLAVARLRKRSLERASRTLSGDPPPPASAPSAAQARAASYAPYEPSVLEPEIEGAPDAEPPVEPEEPSQDGQADEPEHEGPDEQDGQDDESESDVRRIASEVEDGTGDRLDPGESSGR